MLRTLLSSSAESPFTVYGDSDDLQVQRFSPNAVLSLRTGTWLSAGYDRTRLEARGPAAASTRSTALPSRNYEHIWTRATQRVGWITVHGQAGYATGAEHVMTTYGIGFDARLADSIRIALSRTLEPFVVSPRTVDLGLTTTSHRGQMEWSPTLRNQLVFDGVVPGTLRRQSAVGNEHLAPTDGSSPGAASISTSAQSRTAWRHVATSITATTIRAAMSFMRRRCTHTSRCAKTSAWR